MKKRSFSKAIAGALAAISFCASLPLLAQTAKPVKKQISISLPMAWQTVVPRERLKAVRVAQLDAYRALAERVYGFKLSSGATVYDFMLESDQIKNSIQELLKGAVEIERPEYTEDGIVQVVYAIALEDVAKVIDANATSIESRQISEFAADVTKKLITERKLIEALGNGALPGSKGLRMIRAKRAAELDAYRKMAERFAGVRITSETTVGDFCLKNDKMQAAAAAFLKGLKPVAVEYLDDGTCQVTMQLKIREIVETVETMADMAGTGASEESIQSVNKDFNDRTFRVVGTGAPESQAPAVPQSVSSAVDSGLEQARKVFKTVISKEITIE
jgi:hypothetical protein